MTVIPIHFPVPMKRQLDQLKRDGYTIAGFVRRAVEKELAKTAQTRRRRRSPHVQ